MAAKIKLIAEISSNNFKIPLDNGWKREVILRSLPGGRPNSDNASVYYISPNGERLRTKKEILLHLEKDLNINMFTLTRKPIGHANEVVRTAPGKEYRMQQNQPVHNQFHNKIFVNNVRDSVLLEHKNHLLTNLERRYAEIAQVDDVEKLRQMLYEKEDTIEDLKACLARNEAEISKLRKELATNPKINVENMKNVIEKMFPMLSKNQIDLITKQKKKVDWTCEEISDGFALSYFSRKGYSFLIKKLEYPLPSIRTLQRWAEKMNVKPGILEDSFVVLKGLRKNLTEGESQVRKIVSYCEYRIVRITFG